MATKTHYARGACRPGGATAMTMDPEKVTCSRCKKAVVRIAKRDAEKAAKATSDAAPVSFTE